MEENKAENHDGIWVHAKEAELWKEWYANIPKISFEEALEKLGIEKYKDRILNSNSHGETFHCLDYIILASIGIDKERFSEWFDKVVEFAEQKWTRPESIFQHIGQIFTDSANPTKNVSENS